MSGSNDVSDARVIAALLDPINIKIFEFLKTSGPFKVGLIKAKLIDVPLTKPGFLKRLRNLEKLGFIVRLEKRGSKSKKKNQHVTWQPFDSDFYEKLLQQRISLIRIAEETKNMATVSIEIPKAFDKATELNSIHDDPKKVAQLMEELRAKVSILLDKFDILSGTMKKRTLEWAVQAKYFEKLAYT